MSLHESAKGKDCFYAVSGDIGELVDSHPAVHLVGCFKL